MSHAVLGYRDGWLCAVEITVRANEPIQDTTYWPLFRERRDIWEEDLGKELSREGLYTYRVRIGGWWKTLALAQGGQTPPLAVESAPVPKPPRVRSELRWHGGRWQKYHTKKGWIVA